MEDFCASFRMALRIYPGNVAVENNDNISGLYAWIDTIAEPEPGRVVCFKNFMSGQIMADWSEDCHLYLGSTCHCLQYLECAVP